MIKLRTLCLLIFLFPIFLFGQVESEYDSISDLEKEITSTPLDTLADAIILLNKGVISYDQKDYYADIEVHKRIKILTKNGMEEANISIPYYATNGVEKIFNIEAQTINIDSTGQVKKIPVDDKEFYPVDLDGNWKEIRFTFPGIKIGSIIEFQYVKKTRQIYSLERWYFQTYLPILQSELYLDIDPDITYSPYYSGERLREKYKGQGWKDEIILKNVKPIKDEPYAPLVYDYYENIRFQLSSFRGIFPPRSWTLYSREYLKKTTVRNLLRQNGFAKRILRRNIRKKDPDSLKLKNIFSYVQKKIKWDGNYSIVPDQKNLVAIMKSEVGNGAGLNLSLVRLLKSAGFNAKPFLVSTKRNGKPNKKQLIYNQFNHVIAYVNLDGEDIFLDATSENLPYDYLPINTLNEMGCIMDKRKAKWKNFEIPEDNKQKTSIELEIKDVVWNYKVEHTISGYRAAFLRDDYKNYSEEQEFITSELHGWLENDEISLDSFKIQNIDNWEKDITVSCYFSKEKEGAMDEDFLYLNPMELFRHFSKNPFTTTDRNLPIDLLYPFSDHYKFNLNLPSNYELVEKLEETQIDLPIMETKYRYSFEQQSKDQIQVISDLDIKSTILEPSEYSGFRELFSELFKHQEKTLVLKKLD